MTALRVVVAERKSRAGDAAEDNRYRRQENKNIRTAEASGHVTVTRVADTVSSQTLPWKRRNLRTWFEDPAKVALWDAVLISEVSRISRGDSDTWFEIERWCRANNKLIMDASGLTWPSADDKEWDDKRRGAREYWESVRDSHAEVRADIRAAGAAIGRPPFGYTTAPREDGYKRFTPDANAGIVVEAFRRIADGESASSVARWLQSLDVRRADQPYFKNGVRVKFVTDTIRNAAYLGQRDGHTYDLLPGLTAELWESANAVLDARYVPHHSGGKIADGSFSGCLFCGRCGAVMYRHQSRTRDGRPSGKERYQCSRGRVGATSEAKCELPRLVADDVNSALDALMRSLVHLREIIVVTNGGSHAKDAELQRLNKQLATATAAQDMARVIELANLVKAAQERPDAPLEVSRIMGRSYAELWIAGDHAERRALLTRGGLRMVADVNGVHVDYLNLNNDDDDDNTD